MVNNDFLMGYGAGKAAGGGGATLITKTISENGTYAASSDNADGYSSVTVNVAASGYSAEDFLFMNRPTGEFYSEIASGGSEASIKGRTGITSINMPNWTYGVYATFNGCTGVTRVNFPVMTGCSSQFLYNCINLDYFILPRGYQLGTNALYGCNKLKAVDLGGTPPADQGITGTSVFTNCIVLATIVLRSTTVIPLGNVNSFNNTHFASGKSGGTLYVPQALISSYQSATNWSTILGYTNNQIKAIEGSIYETQYADGTPIT